LSTIRVLTLKRTTNASMVKRRNNALAGSLVKCQN
jgi:hypothetical protein